MQTGRQQVETCKRGGREGGGVADLQSVLQLGHLGCQDLKGLSPFAPQPDQIPGGLRAQSLPQPQTTCNQDIESLGCRTHQANSCAFMWLQWQPGTLSSPGSSWILEQCTMH